MTIRSEKKNSELLARAKSRSAASVIKQIVPGQLAFWSDDRRAIANELARSALIHCRDNRKQRKHYDNAQLFVLGEGSLTYTGEELRTRDEDILLTLAHCARDMESGKMVVKTTSSDICKLNNWRQDQRYYEEIFRSIQRMKGGVITVFSRRLAKSLKCQRALEAGASEEELGRLYDELKQFEDGDSGQIPLDQEGAEIAGMMMSLISGEPVFTGAKAVINGIPQGNLTWEITLDKKLVYLFAKPYLTYVNHQTRMKLSSTGKRLQSYFLSHQHPHPVLLRSLEAMCDLDYKKTTALKSKIAEELTELQKEGVIESFEFKRSADGKDWKACVVRPTPESAKEPKLDAPTS